MTIKRILQNRFGISTGESDIPKFTERIEGRVITFERENGISRICLEKNGQNYVFVYRRENTRKVLVRIGQMAVEDQFKQAYPDFCLHDAAYLERIIRNFYEIN